MLYFDIIVRGKNEKEAEQLLKKITTILLAIIFALAAMPVEQQAEAAMTYTFVNVKYNESVNKDGTVNRTLSKVTLKNSAGKTATFTIDKSAILYINNTTTTIEGFKAGMAVTVKVNLRKVTEMRGTTTVDNGSIVPNSKQKAGVVTKIDPNGLFITVKLDGTGAKTYYVKNTTTIIKGKSTVDLSTLYEGDRVKLKFASANTTAISEIEIITSGIMVDNLYKAKLNTVNTSKNSFTVQNAHPFTNWLFGENETLDKNTFTFSSSTTIYAGNEKISKSELKNYKNSEMYFVTTKQFSKEVVHKVVVLANNERTYYQSLAEVNPKYGYFALSKVGRLYYHDGSILIRNGRLVEPDTLASNGTAYVITDGNTSDKYAHVVNITNDSFTSPNLASHQLYFGRLDLADLAAYKVELSGMEYFKNNFWTKFTTESVFSFSNSTTVTELDGDTQYKIIPETELFLYEGQYGYFYVKDGHIQAIHFIKNEARSAITATGRISSIGTNSISVKDVSQWIKGGEWSYYGATKVDINKVVIIKNGKAIKASDLKPSDRVVLLMDENFVTHVVMVNE